MDVGKSKVDRLCMVRGFMLRNNVVVGVMTEAACERGGERIEAKLLLLFFLSERFSQGSSIKR